jgi:hypothetical protein
VLVAALACALATTCGARTELDGLRVSRALDAGMDVFHAPDDAPAPDDAADARLAEDAMKPSDVPRESGCSDTEREGFTDLAAYPNIAGCSGAWSIPGIHTENPGVACGVPTYDTVTRSCLVSGDDTFNPNGGGCNVQDLCAERWHVCVSADDVALHSPTGCVNATRSNDPPLFFATRQSSSGCGNCATGVALGCDSLSCATGCAQTADTSNDFFGCGNFGSTSPINGCGPLDRFSNDACTGLPGSSWHCATSYCEAYTVTKTDPGGGGVLCCRD